MLYLCLLLLKRCLTVALVRPRSDLIRQRCSLTAVRSHGRVERARDWLDTWEREGRMENNTSSLNWLDRKESLPWQFQENELQTHSGVRKKPLLPNSGDLPKISKVTEEEKEEQRQETARKTLRQHSAKPLTARRRELSAQATYLMRRRTVPTCDPCNIPCACRSGLGTSRQSNSCLI